MDGGIYTIQVANNGNGIEQCNDLYLAYLKDSDSQRPFLMSSTAKKPSQWRIYSLGKDAYKLETADRPSDLSSKLSYSPACSSKSVRLNAKDRLSWRLIAVDQDKGLYRVVTSNKNCEKPVYGRLAPLSVAQNRVECDEERSLILMPISQATYGFIWNFTLVASPPQPSSVPISTTRPPLPSTTPPPTTAPPPVPVEVPEVTVAVAFLGISIEQFAEEEKNNLCRTLIESANYPPEKIICTVVVTPLSQSGRRLHQDGVEAIATLQYIVDSVEDSQQALQSATSVDQEAQQEGAFDDVSNEDTGTAVLGTTIDTTTKEVPAPTPTPTPTVTPTPTPSPNVTVEPTPTPQPTDAPTPEPTTTPPPTTAPPLIPSPYPNGGNDGTPITIPSAPSNVQALYGSTQCSVNGGKSLTVTWSPNPTGEYVESYTLQCTSTAGDVVELANLPNTDFSTSIDSLQEGQTYQCSVYAVNAAGSSAPGTSSSFETVDVTLK